MGNSGVRGKSNEALKLPISEMFCSVAGEGLDIGRPSFFVRVKGCPKPWCRFCDTPYARKIPTRNERSKIDVSIGNILLEVEKVGVKHVTVTGGNPAFYKVELRELVKKLKFCGYKVTLQEKGSYYDEETWFNVDCVDFDVKTPFTGIGSDLGLLKFLRPGKDYVKFLIASGKDYEFFKECYPLCRGLTCVLQPGIRPFEEIGNMWEKLQKITELVLEDKLDVRILPQLHKQLYGMRKRGV